LSFRKEPFASLTRYETSGEAFSAPRYLASPGLIPCHHVTVMRRANVEAILADVWAAHPVMAKSQEPVLTIGSLHYGRLVPHLRPRVAATADVASAKTRLELQRPSSRAHTSA
jgi:hypothetical protein